MTDTEICILVTITGVGKDIIIVAKENALTVKRSDIKHLYSKTKQYKGENKMKVDIYNTDKKYDIIYADPPWQQSKGGKKSVRANSSGKPLDYKTITLEEIKEHIRQATSLYGHEYLLYMYKGKLRPVATEERGKIHSVFTEKVQRHSQKPQVAYEIIERLYPDTNKLEMYARNYREGWDCWGDEV